MMIKLTGRAWRFPIAAVLLLSMLACQLGGTDTPTPTPTAVLSPELDNNPADAATSEPTATVTPTPTPEPVLEVPPTATPELSPCVGLNGSVEVQVLMGPAEVVGLEPTGVGNVPFSVTSSEAPWLVEGGGTITYQDVLVEDDLTYDVSFDASLELQGDCSGTADAAQLALVLTMDWNQVVEVTGRDFHGEYPVDGSQTIDVVFPLEEGATYTMEGAVLVLHLNP